MSDFIAKHALRGLVVTLGKRGAVALTDSSEYAETGPPAATPVVDTVGAGDAFTAVIIVGLMYDWPLRQTLLRAQAFASEIVQRQGAIAREADFYRAVVSNWHEQARD